MAMNLERQATRESVTRENVTDRRLSGPGNRKFIFVHWPGSFELVPVVDDEGETVGYELMPRVRRMDLNPGAMGVKWLPNANNALGKIDPTMFYLYLESQRAIRIPDNAPICYTGDDGEIYEDPDPGYLWSMELQSGAKLYIDPWDNPTPKRTGGVDFHGRDIKGFQAWCRLLLARGVIPDPTPADLDEMIRLQRRRAERHANKASGNPILLARVEIETARLDAMLKEQASRFRSVTKRKAPKSNRKREATD